MSRIWIWFFACICLAGIMYFSQQQYSQQDISPWIKQSEPLVSVVKALPVIEFDYYNDPGLIINSHQDTVSFIHFMARKLAHVTIYGLFGLSLLLALRTILKNPLIRWIIAGILVFVVAGLDEANQFYSSSRTGCQEDILLDFSGFMLFSLVYLISSRLKNREQRT